jgi:DNA mismatch endonuclease (patch repair protein)
MDTVDRQTRSRIMSSVGQKDTGPEMLLRAALHRAGLRFRLHDRTLPGSPDLVLPRFRSVVFVHGCYWHSHGCHRSTIPKSDTEFWLTKFRANKHRDKQNVQLLLEDDWRVMIVWECAITGKSAQSAAELTANVYAWLKSSMAYAEVTRTPSQKPRSMTNARSQAE